MLMKSIFYSLFFLFFSANLVFPYENKQCKPPYKPSNIFIVIFNYSEGMNYIASAKENCSKKFALELAKTFRESFWISKGCLEITLQDIHKAKKQRRRKLT